MYIFNLKQKTFSVKVYTKIFDGGQWPPYQSRRTRAAGPEPPGKMLTIFLLSLCYFILNVLLISKPFDDAYLGARVYYILLVLFSEIRIRNYCAVLGAFTCFNYFLRGKAFLQNSLFTFLK
jgi:phosphatidylglycerophosphate synthase